MRRSSRLNKLSGENNGDTAHAGHPPPPVPKKPKRIPRKDRPRPEYPYELIHKMPVTEHMPDAAEMTNPLTLEQSRSLGYSVHASRNGYLNGAMFETVWSRKPKVKTENEPNMLNRMFKLCDCTFIMGPHRLLGRLFTLKEEEASTGRSRGSEGGAPSNQMVIYRLQQMAKEDPELKTLMAEVATGKASPQLVAEFQKYIQKAREIDNPSGTSTEPAPASTPASPPPPAEKPMSLAFEFNDNVNERFVFSRDSIIELLDNKERDILVSFLCVRDGFYTPLTITIRDMPPRFYPTVEKCFEHPNTARKNMTEIMQTNKRAKNHYVWYQIDKTDTLVQDEIRRLQPPYFAVAQPKRQYKTRKYQQKYPVATPPYSAPVASTGTAPTPKVSTTVSAAGSTPPVAVKQEAKPQSSDKDEVRPKLNLPDVNSFQIPPGGLPPLPKSLQGLVPPKK